jgi:glycosyltransferase involved in cell wall biosynthesis
MNVSALESAPVFLKSAADSVTINEALVDDSPLPQCKLCIAIPVRDEAASIESTLQALANQVDLTGRALSRCYEVLLFANNCIDGTADIARRFAQQHPELSLHVVERYLPQSQAYVGKARQLVMDEAYRRIDLLGGRGAIATTDGDTQVSPTWVAANLYEMARGADAVGGRIYFHKHELKQLTPAAQALRLRSFGYSYLKSKLAYYLDPSGSEFPSRHHQHYGASLAVSAEAYRRAGGLPATKTPEDVAFYQALKRIDARFCHSALARVTTSARLQGRTDIGCAHQLSEWVSSPHPLFVNGVEAIENRLLGRRQLRITWQRIMNGETLIVQEMHALAHQLGVTKSWLIHELNQNSFFGQLAERVKAQQQAEGIWQQRWPLVDIGSAIASLRLRLRKIAQEQAILARISQVDTAGCNTLNSGADSVDTAIKKSCAHHRL